LDFIPSSELDGLFNEAVRSTFKRRYGYVDSEFTGLETRALKKLKVKHGIVQNKPDVTTDARLSACMCPRMSYMWYLICWTLSRTLPGVLKWNADASTYVFEAKGKGDTICSLAKDSDLRRLLATIDAENDGAVPIVVQQVEQKQKEKTKANLLATLFHLRLKLCMCVMLVAKVDPSVL
jgi:hypothetical protein